MILPRPCKGRLLQTKPSSIIRLTFYIRSAHGFTAPGVYLSNLHSILYSVRTAVLNPCSSVESLQFYFILPWPLIASGGLFKRGLIQCVRYTKSRVYKSLLLEKKHTYECWFLQCSFHQFQLVSFSTSACLLCIYIILYMPCINQKVSQVK